MLLNTYKYHHTETLFIFTTLCPCLDLGLFISYLYALFFIFIFIFITINRIFHEYRHTCSFACFLDYVLLFLDDDVMKVVNNFQMVKGQPKGVA